MFCSKLFTLAAYVLSVSAAPTLWLAGDSTTAASGAGVTYQGWGTQIGQYLSIPVQNSAIPGKSTRSFTVQGNCSYFSRGILQRGLTNCIQSQHDV